MGGTFFLGRGENNISTRNIYGKSGWEYGAAQPAESSDRSKSQLRAAAQ